MEDFSRLGEVLDTGAVALVLLDLKTFPPAAEVALSAEEAQRLAGFRHASSRDAFLAGRRLLRSALHSLLHEDVPLDIDPRGKPFCPHPRAPHFNLSHGAGWIAAAFSREVAVGIDIEDTRRSVPHTLLARRYYSPGEYERVCREGPACFFAIWTRKEARVKADGHGLAHGKISSFDVDDLPGWNFHDFQPVPYLVGSLAYAGIPRPIVPLLVWP